MYSLKLKHVYSRRVCFTLFSFVGNFSILFYLMIQRFDCSIQKNVNGTVMHIREDCQITLSHKLMCHFNLRI